MSKLKTVELFYDVLSPYSWIGFEVLLRCRSVWNINVELQPILLAGIMKATDNTPPGLNPTKATYMIKDLQRTFAFYNLGTYKPPDDPVTVYMVKGSLPTMRLLTAAKMSHPEKLESLSIAFWIRTHRTDEDIVSPDSLVEVCKKVGLSAAESSKLVEDSKSSTVKDKLQETTERALDHGAFGAPVFLVDSKEGEKKEMFFGSDRFDHLAHHLGVEWPLISTPESKL